MTGRGRIVVADDDEGTCALLRRLLEGDHEVVTAATAAEALGLVAEGRPDLLFLDIKLPDGDGRRVLRRLRRTEGAPRLPVVLMTAHPESGRLGLAVGADAVLHKPLKRDEVLGWVRCLLPNGRAGDGASEVDRALLAIAEAIEARSGHRQEHVRRVVAASERLAAALGLGGAEADAVRTAAVHDLGMIAVPEAVLWLPRSLAPEEFDAVKPHAVLGAEIARALPEGERVAPIVRGHHERWSGGGYPDGIGGETIPLGARIVAVVDAFDALTSPRSYREALPAHEALDVLWRGAGAQWDPAIVEQFAALVRSQEVGPEPVARRPVEAVLRYLAMTGDRP